MPDPFDDFDISRPFEPAPAYSPVNPPTLAGLNAEQKEAVESSEGPLLVLSGAGTGKTRVLTSRLAHLLLLGKAKPWQCLAVTFTNRAAREMRERVAGIVGPSSERVWLGTFHALGARMLRRHAEIVGLTSSFSILDSDDQLRLLRQVMEAEGIDSKKNAAQTLMNMIQRWKDRARIPDQIDASESGDFARGRAHKLYALYQDRLRTLNACDFGDLLLHVLTILKKDPEVLAQYQEQFRYIMVDEYQDTNVAQYLWLRLLAQKHRNLCCVGDDDQSIYSWRGAEVGNILRFEKDFPDAKIIRLEANYRSTPAILAAASGLIAHNQGRLGKTLRAGDADAEHGEKLTVRGLWDGEEEARWVGEEIEALQRRGIDAGDIAILVRAGFQTREFEERLITIGVPYRVIGGMRFYERQEIRDAIAYLRLISQSADDLAFERIVNLPKRGIGDSTLQALHIHARARGLSLVGAALEIVETDELKPKARQAVRGFLEDLSRWRAIAQGVSHTDLAQTVLDESGYVDMWRRQKTPDAQGRIENLKELISSMQSFDALSGFLEHVALVMDNEEQETRSRITLMTLHAAKGLEFEAVFLPGWEEGIFPHQRALEESGAAGLEEERRLAYVGLTRAKKQIFISHAANRRIYNQWQNALPSRFLEELPASTLNRHAEKNLFGGADEAAGAWARNWSQGYANQRQRQSQRGSLSLEGESGSKSGYNPGERVFHQKFGQGTVLSVEGTKLEISFDKSGIKKVIDSFVAPL